MDGARLFRMIAKTGLVVGAAFFAIRFYAIGPDPGLLLQTAAIISIFVILGKVAGMFVKDSGSGNNRSEL